MTVRRVLTVLFIGTVVLLAFVFAAAVHETSVGGEPNADVALRDLAARADVDVGTAVREPALRDYSGYRTELAREFSTVTPEDAMKWDAIEPARGQWRWDGADALVDFAREHDQVVRGHTLVWHNQLPRWLGARTWKPDALRDVLRDHIRAVVGRYRGRIAEWDVLNELTAEGGKGLRPSLWSDTLGESFPQQALRWAHEADPDAKLYWNEIGADGLSPKSDEFYRRVKALVDDGVPLDGVGFQSHFNLDGVPKGFEKNLRRFADLGLDVRVTELDVALKTPVDDAALRAQADVYARTVRACLRVKRCRGLTVWGFTDRFSWIPAAQSGFGEATLLDEQLQPKPAYSEFAEALRAGR